MEEIVRLTSADYEQAIDFLDLVFSQAKKPHHFEKMPLRLAMPDAMTHHFALKRDGASAPCWAFIRPKRP